MNDIETLMVFQALGFSMLISMAIVIYMSYTGSLGKQEAEIAYDESDEEDERIQNVRFHGKHDS